MVKSVLKRIYCAALHHREWKLIPFPYHIISKREFVQCSWSCLHLSFPVIKLVRDVLSTENILHASTFVNSLSILKHSLFFSRSRGFSGDNRFSRSSFSSYDLLCKDVIILVALHWAASSFAICFALWGAHNCTAYSRWDLTELIYSGRIVFIFK